MRYLEERNIEEIFRIMRGMFNLHWGHLKEHATEIENIKKTVSEFLKLTPERAEFVHQPSREHKEIRFLVILNDLRLAAETTLESFDDLGQRLDCFCRVQEKADSLYEAVRHLDLRRDVRKQIALTIRDAVRNIYAEDLEKENLQALLKAIKVAAKEELHPSDHMQVLEFLYEGDLDAYPHLDEDLSKIIEEENQNE
ncbi:hypothetical protein CEE36_02835 [candidate division TA06 bacterium B3_TA06]|uniref:Uncharacterized protein n=1 Tax=candidate division TA06 bacterium B3_TA06 TaxID=2012487 RepID=A0A532V8V7_UNCT6|nr:MAG: hypothetical protein CEE36_02835 [candidate division TA06 bacterium B3_TA06]